MRIENTIYKLTNLQIMKQYIAPRIEDIQLETLMVDFLGVAQVSGGNAATVIGGQGA